MPGAEPQDGGRGESYDEEHARLKREQNRAIADEDFVLARLLQTRIDALDARYSHRKAASEAHTRQQKLLAALEEQKKQAIMRDDFALAERIKEEQDSFCEAVSQRLDNRHLRLSQLKGKQAEARSQKNVELAMHLQHQIEELESGGAPGNEPRAATICEQIMRLELRKVEEKAKENFDNLRKLKEDIEFLQEELREVLLPGKGPFKKKDNNKMKHTDEEDDDETGGLLGGGRKMVEAGSGLVVSIFGRRDGDDEGTPHSAALSGSEGESPNPFKARLNRLIRVVGLCACLVIVVLFVLSKFGAGAGAARQVPRPGGDALEAQDAGVETEGLPVQDFEGEPSAATAVTPSPASAAPTTWEVPDWEPTTSSKGIKKCPKGSDKIKRKEECQQAAQLMGMHWGPPAPGVGPAGCILRSSKITWNTVSIAKGPEVQIVCKSVDLNKDAGKR